MVHDSDDVHLKLGSIPSGSDPTVRELKHRVLKQEQSDGWLKVEWSVRMAAAQTLASVVIFLKDSDTKMSTTDSITNITTTTTIPGEKLLANEWAPAGAYLVCVCAIFACDRELGGTINMCIQVPPSCARQPPPLVCQAPPLSRASQPPPCRVPASP